MTGRDAFEHILCGASMVQIGTTLHKEGVGALNASLRSSKLSWKKKTTKPWKTSVGNCTTLTNLSKELPQVETWGSFLCVSCQEKDILFLVLGIFHFYREKKGVQWR